MNHALNKMKIQKKKLPGKEEGGGTTCNLSDVTTENSDLFSDEQINFKLKNVEALKCAKNYGEKSDILRYEILCQFGGIYVDCDFECLKSFDGLLMCRFFTGFSNTLAAVEVG